MADPGQRDRRVILHVEDEAPNRALLRAVVTRASEPMVRDATLLEAGNLATARAMLSSESIDLVLLDVRLPDGNGLDLAREIRDSALTRPAAVIVMSASVRSSEQAAALSAGADHFLAKPYDPQVLVALIADRLRDRPALH
jgi:CheY-like chemotaxis protein